MDESNTTELNKQSSLDIIKQIDSTTDIVNINAQGLNVGTEALPNIDYVSGYTIKKLTDTFDRGSYVIELLGFLTDDPDIIEHKQELLAQYGTTDEVCGVVAIVPAYKCIQNTNSNELLKLQKFDKLHLVLCSICACYERISNNANDISKRTLNFLKDVFFKSAVEKYPELISTFSSTTNLLTCFTVSKFITIFAQILPNGLSSTSFIPFSAVTKLDTNFMGLLEIKTLSEQNDNGSKIEEFLIKNKEVQSNILTSCFPCVTNLKKLVKLPKNKYKISLDAVESNDSTFLSSYKGANPFKSIKDKQTLTNFSSSIYFGELLLHTLIYNSYINNFGNGTNTRGIETYIKDYTSQDENNFLKNNSPYQVILSNARSVYTSHTNSLVNSTQTNANYSIPFIFSETPEDLDNFIELAHKETKAPNTNTEESLLELYDFFKHEDSNLRTRIVQNNVEELTAQISLDKKLLNALLSCNIALNFKPWIHKGYYPLVLSQDDLYDNPKIKIKSPIFLPAVYSPTKGKIFLHPGIHNMAIAILSNTDLFENVVGHMYSYQEHLYGTQIRGIELKSLTGEDFFSNSLKGQNIIKAIGCSNAAGVIFFVLDLIWKAVKGFDKNYKEFVAEKHTLIDNIPEELISVKDIISENLDILVSNPSDAIAAKSKISQALPGNLKTYVGINLNAVHTLCTAYQKNTELSDINIVGLTSEEQESITNTIQKITLAHDFNKKDKNINVSNTSEFLVEETELGSSVDGLDLEDKVIRELYINKKKYVSCLNSFLQTMGFHQYILRKYVKLLNKTYLIEEQKRLSKQLISVGELLGTYNNSGNTTQIMPTVKDSINNMLSENQQKFLQQISILKKNKKIKAVYYLENEGMLFVQLQEHTYVTDPRNGLKHDLGSILLSIPYQVQTNRHLPSSIADIKIYKGDQEQLDNLIAVRDSIVDTYLSYYDIDQEFIFAALHVNEHGWFCAGDSKPMLIKALEQDNLILLVNIMIQYVESVNVLDTWGKRIPEVNVALDETQPYPDFIQKYVLGNKCVGPKSCYAVSIKDKGYISDKGNLSFNSIYRSLYKKFMSIPQEFFTSEHLQDLANQYLNTEDNKKHLLNVPVTFVDNKDTQGTTYSLYVNKENYDVATKKFFSKHSLGYSSTIRNVDLDVANSKSYSIKGCIKRLPLNWKFPQKLKTSGESSYFGEATHLSKLLSLVDKNIIKNNYSYQLVLETGGRKKQCSSLSEQILGYEINTDRMNLLFLSNQSPMYYNLQSYRWNTSFISTGYIYYECSHPIFVKDVTPSLNAEFFLIKDELNVIFYRKGNFSELEELPELTNDDIISQKEEIYKVMPFLEDAWD